EAAAAWRRHTHTLPGLNADILNHGQLRRNVDPRTVGLHRLDDDRVGAAVLPAQHNPPPGSAMILHHGRARLAAPEADRIVPAETAAILAGAAGALVQRILLKQRRIILLHHLDGCGLGNPDGRTAVADAIAAIPAAIAATRDHIHDVGASALGIVTAQRQIPRGACRCGEKPVWLRLHQRVEYRLRDALAHLRGTARDRPRISGIQEGVVWVLDLQRREGAGI